MTTVLFALILGVGPQMDLIEGSEVSVHDRSVLPSGRHSGYDLDLYFVEIVNMQHTGGGIALFDPLRISSHGRSFTQQRFLLNGVDITDPARPGSPMLEIPRGAWQSMGFKSLWTSRPGIRWRLKPADAPRAEISSGYGGDVGGPLLIPDGLMDREPASDHGSTRDRRKLSEAREIAGQSRLNFDGGAALVYAEALRHEHQYPTLLDPEGSHIRDDARRFSGLITASARLGAADTWWTAAWQHRDRSHDGGELRFPEELTQKASSQALLGAAGAELSFGRGWALSVGGAFGWRADDASLRRHDPIVSDIEDEWMWMHRPRFGGESQSLMADANLEFRHGDEVKVGLIANHGLVSEEIEIPGNRVGQTYLRGDDEAVSMTLFDPLESSEFWVQRIRPEIEGKWNWNAWTVNASFGIDYSAVGTPQERRLSMLSPGLGVAVRRRFGGVEFFTLLRREPEPLTAEAARFLDPQQPSGARYRWLDDGDAIPELGERGEILARTGARYHEVDADIRQPASNHFAIGVKTGKFGPFRAVLSGIARFLTDPFTVRFPDREALGYRPVEFRDPGGDGRGETNASGGGQELTVYAREPGSEGQETYQLTNLKDANFYVGAEVQMVTDSDTWWFVNLGGAGYWNVGSAPFGSFPDRNDPGIIDEVSADPNARVNQRGRFDQDRAFALNWMAGVKPAEGLTAAVAIRYRDGQPFVRMVVAEDLPQGPTPIMAVWRGGARHTFHMTLDARVRYAIVVEPYEVALSLDGFNLLGSGTEILEDPRSGSPFRRSLEMVPPRAVFGTLELGWR